MSNIQHELRETGDLLHEICAQVKDEITTNPAFYAKISLYLQDLQRSGGYQDGWEILTEMSHIAGFENRLVKVDRVIYKNLRAFFYALIHPSEIIREVIDSFLGEEFLHFRIE